MAFEGVDCETVARDVASGADPAASHLRDCATCRALYGRPSGVIPAPPSVPTARVFAGRWRREWGVRAALAAVILLGLAMRAETPAPDLLAIVDDADDAAEILDDLDDGDALLALLDPTEDPFLTADRTLDALTGEASF